MEKVFPTPEEMKDRAEKALLEYGPRKKLAMAIGVSEGELSRSLTLTTYKAFYEIGIDLKDQGNVEVAPEYLSALKLVAKEELKP